MFTDENKENSEKLPIYQKGDEIYQVVSKICDLIDDDDRHLGHVKAIMLEDAMLLEPKEAGCMTLKWNVLQSFARLQWS